MAYVDESYSDDLYYIAALIVPENSARPLTIALDEIVGKVAAAHPELDPRAELHAHQLVMGKGDWAPVRPMLRLRIGIYQDALRAIAAHDCTVIVRGIDIRAQQRRYPHPDHPHSVVLTHLIERVNDYAQDRDEFALLIADEIDQMDEYRRDLWFLQRNGTWGWRARPIEHIIDTLHFAPSRSSRLLQAADLCAYLYRRHHAHVETDARAEREWEILWRMLEASLRHHHCWVP